METIYPRKKQNQKPYLAFFRTNGVFFEPFPQLAMAHSREWGLSWIPIRTMYIDTWSLIPNSSGPPSQDFVLVAFLGRYFGLKKTSSKLTNCGPRRMTAIVFQPSISTGKNRFDMNRSTFGRHVCVMCWWCSFFKHLVVAGWFVDW